MDEVFTETEYFGTGLAPLIMCRPNVLHGNLPTVQVIHRHLSCGERAYLCRQPTPSTERNTSGILDRVDGDPKRGWGSQKGIPM